MAVILQAQEVGEIIDDLKTITDLVGTAEKKPRNEGDLLRIRIIAKRITKRIYNEGRVHLEEPEATVC